MIIYVATKKVNIFIHGFLKSEKKEIPMYKVDIEITVMMLLYLDAKTLEQ